MSRSNNNVNRLPRVSVGMPVYNADRYLPLAIDAILKQTYSDFELIISDNGSTDDTQILCERYARSDNRVSYYRSAENQGVSWNFNRVFELSHSEYFKWAASDDICQPTFLERCVEILETDATAVCCHTHTRKIDASGEIIQHLLDPTQISSRTASSSSPPHRFQDVLLSSGWSARSYGVLRSETLRRTSLIMPYYGFEKVLMAELALNGRFIDVPETLFLQRVHEDASSNLKSASQQQQFFSPTLARRRTFPRLRLLQGYLTAIQRAPIRASQRLQCLGYLGQYLCQFSKWAGVVKAALRGTGNGAAGRDLKFIHSNDSVNTV